MTLDSRITKGGPTESDARPGVRRAPALRPFAAIAVVALGAIAVLPQLPLPKFVVLAGVGLLLTGLLTFLDATGAFGAGRPISRFSWWFASTTAAVLITAGLSVLLWKSASVEILTFIFSGAILALGLHGLISAIRGTADHRLASLFGGAAGIGFGAFLLMWPVLTIALIRVVVGFWLVFTGLRALLGPLADRFRRDRCDRGDREHHAPSPVWRHVLNWGRTLLTAAALIAVIALSVGSLKLFHEGNRPAPDGFYAAPESMPEQAGVLLRVEPFPGVAPKGAEAWKILYTTTRADGTATVGSGTVLAPKDRGPDPLPVLSVAHGTTGIVPKCAPSLNSTPFADGAEAALFDMVGTHGWVAVTADYLGLGTSGTHPYLVGEVEARNVLDATRAARELDQVSIGKKTVVWGHSQGGHAALWTGQSAGAYAPELEILGIAAMAPATDLYTLAGMSKDTIAGKTVSAYIAASWNANFPKLNLAAKLTPGTAHEVSEIADLCFNQHDALDAIARGSEIPEQVFPDSLLENGDLGRLLRENTPIGPFPAPVLVAQGLADPLVKPEMQKEWVKDRCAAGEELDFRTYAGRDHMGVVASDSPLTPQLVEWTLDRWGGKAPTPNCGARSR